MSFVFYCFIGNLLLIVATIVKLFQILHNLLTYGLKVNGDSLPNQIFLHVMIAMNQEISHIRYLSPLQVAVSLAKFEGQHVGSLADNHDVVDDGMIRPPISKKLFHATTSDILEYRVNSL